MIADAIGAERPMVSPFLTECPSLKFVSL
jgi:hypothetical protein